MYFVRSNLAVCGFADIGSRQQFETFQFHAQLQCAEDFDTWLTQCLEVKTLPFPDGFPIHYSLFQEAQTWLAQHWLAGHNILISCAAGQSRSVSMAIALLFLQGQGSFLEVARETCGLVKEAYPHPLVLVSTAKYCGFEFDFDMLYSFFYHLPDQPLFPWTEKDLILSLEWANQV
jgi:hypothetical protein